MQKAIFQVHLWCGVLVGAFLAFQGITGSAVAFRHAGNQWLHAAELKVQPQGRSIVPLSRVIDAFHERFPDIPENVLSVMYPLAPDEAYFIRVWKDGSAAPNMYVSVNPYTGEITGSGSKWQYPFELMFRLHEQLSAGTPGINLVHIGGFLMSLMSLTGLYLWWPRRETFRQSLDIKVKPLKRFLFTAHRAIGAYTFVLVFAVAFSGTMIFGVLSLVPGLSPASRGFGMASASLLKPGEATGDPVPIDQIIDTARKYFPNDTVRDLSFIRLMRSVCVVSLIDEDGPNPRALNRVFFERHTGKVINVVDWDELQGVRLIEDWAIPVHSGEIIGSPGRFLVMISGLVMPFLFVTGIWLWLKKRPTTSGPIP